jgi:hypothetical protein
MLQLSAKWNPKCLNADQKRQLRQSSEQLLDFLGDPNDLLSRLVTMDETCLCLYDPETKQQSLEWRHSARPRKIPSAKICWKSSSVDFFRLRRHPPH